MLKDILKIEPSSMTITPTHKCTASCHDCCFACTPAITHVMETEKVIKYIDEAISTFPSIKLVVITGGECFLLGNNLDYIIKHASSYGVMVRVVTNGFWANTYEDAYNRLQSLVDAGLTELNISTGDNHQKYVPFANIINATNAAYDLGIQSICISVERTYSSKFKSECIKENHIMKSLIKKGILHVIDAAWMKFKNNVNDFEKKIMYVDNKRPCPNIFRGIVINPYSQMLSCCGLTVEYNKFLKLGNIDDLSIKELYDKQFNDLYKFWLFVDGPEFIYEKLMNYKNVPPKTFPHECAYCIEIIKNEDDLFILRELIKKELPNIIFRYKLNTTQLNII